LLHDTGQLPGRESPNRVLDFQRSLAVGGEVRQKLQSISYSCVGADT
jgi:hypothetical protein